MTRQAPSGMQKENKDYDKTSYGYVWFWKSRLPDRNGQPCRIVARGKMNSILVEFSDGFRVITSRYAVRKQTAHI